MDLAQAERNQGFAKWISAHADHHFHTARQHRLHEHALHGVQFLRMREPCPNRFERIVHRMTRRCSKWFRQWLKGP